MQLQYMITLLLLLLVRLINECRYSTWWHHFLLLLVALVEKEALFTVHDNIITIIASEIGKWMQLLYIYDDIISSKIGKWMQL